MVWTSSLLFLLTGLVGVWAAYDRSTAAGRFALIALGLLLALVIARSGRRSKTHTLTNLSLTCCFLAVGVGGYFLLSHDWTRAAHDNFAPFRVIGLVLQSLLPDLRLLPFPNSNLVAGILVVLIPIGAAGAIRARRRRGPTRRIATVALVVALGALLMTFSRGGWLGLLIGGLYAAYLYWRFDPNNRSPWRWLGDGVLLCSGLVLFIAFGFVVLSPFVTVALGRVGVSGSLLSRPQLWQDSLLLIRDYRFTGSGLGGTAMTFSSYVFLLHVPFLYHAHNLYLQVAIEQGLPGLTAFVFILAVTGWRLRSILHKNSACELGFASSDAGSQGKYAVDRHANLYPQRRHHRPHRRIRLFAAATMGSLIALSVHGMLDAEVYASPWVPLLFLPVGLAFALPDCTPAEFSTAAGLSIPTVLRSATPALVVLAFFLLPNTPAALMANLGAVAQSQAELTLYTKGGWPIQDALRHDKLINLQPAIHKYETALALDPTNNTARRRLGQIALSLNDYKTARRHLETAYQTAPQHRVTRQLLGEVYAATGEIARSVEFWKTVPSEQGQLDLRYRWYERIRAEQELEWIRQSMALSNN